MTFKFTTQDQFENLAESLRAIVPKIIENRIKEYEEQSENFRSSNYLEICKYCHKVEGVAASYGLNQLDEIIRYIHKLAKAEDIAQINQTLPILEEYFSHLKTLSI